MNEIVWRVVGYLWDALAAAGLEDKALDAIERTLEDALPGFTVEPRMGAMLEKLGQRLQVEGPHKEA